MAPQTILLTGASRGIGLAIARYLLSEKHNVFLVARTAGPMEELKRAYPGQVEFLAGDVADDELGRKAVSLALSAFTHLSGLILNHGVLAPVKRISESTTTEWRAAYDTNFFSALSFIVPAIPHLRSTHGRIVLTSSGAAAGSYAGWGCYGSSKAALNHLASTLGVEELDIVTLAIRPGVVDTQMQAEVRGAAMVMDSKDVHKFKGLYESGKLLRPEQPGNVIARLVLGAEKELTGRFLSWDAKELGRYQD